MTYFNGPDGLEEREVLIFDELTDFEGCTTVSIELDLGLLKWDQTRQARVDYFTRKTPLLPRAVRPDAIDIPCEALLNFSVISWIFGSYGLCHLRSDCLSGRSAAMVASALVPDACTCEDTIKL
jgi:hypothetical protein